MRAEDRGFSVTDLNKEKNVVHSVNSALVPRYRDPIAPTLQFLYRPYSIFVLVCLVLGLLYAAIFHTSSSDAVGNIAKYWIGLSGELS